MRLLDTSFENGDPSEGGRIWVETSPPPSYPQDLTHGIVEPTQNPVHTDSWAVYMHSRNGGPEGRCRLNYTFETGESKLAYMRAWFRIKEWDGYIQLLRFWSDHPDDIRYFLDPPAGDYVVTVQINKDNQVKLRIGKHSAGGAQGGQKEFNASYPFQLNYWHCAELGHYITKNSNGFSKVWIDNQLVLQYNGVTDIADWCKWITQSTTGVVLYQDRDGISPATIYIDDYAVDNENRIGTGVGILHNLSVSESQGLKVPFTIKKVV